MAIGDTDLCFYVGSRFTDLRQKKDQTATDEAAVRQAGRDYLAALDRGDRQAIAEFWTKDGTYTDDTGQTFNVRELVQKTFAGNKSVRPPMKVSGVTLRMINNEVAVEEGRSEVTAEGLSAKETPGAAPNGSMAGRFIALWVKQNGQWKLDSLREFRSGAAPPAVSSGSDKLALLEPLVGHWAGTSGKLAMQINAHWNSTKTFLQRELSISSGGKPILSGTQEIGWDPNSQSIKSWTFNSDGCHGEGMWDLDGTSWIVVATGISRSGQATSNMQIFKFPDKNTMKWKLTDTSQEGPVLPELEITLQRQSAAK